MSTVEAVLIGLALAMDCFTVSLTSGTIVKRFVARPMWLMVILFGLFQGGMTLAGWRVSRLFSHYLEPVDHWVAFALLAYIGVRMIMEGFKPEGQKNFNPLSTNNILTLSVATSIDAMAIGVSMAFMGMDTWQTVVWPAGIIALLSSLLTICGLACGILAGRKIPFAVEPLGGIILIGIGVRIVVEHLS